MYDNDLVERLKETLRSEDYPQATAFWQEQLMGAASGDRWLDQTDTTLLDNLNAWDLQADPYQLQAAVQAAPSDGGNSLIEWLERALSPAQPQQWNDQPEPQWDGQDGNLNDQGQWHHGAGNWNDAASNQNDQAASWNDQGGSWNDQGGQGADQPWDSQDGNLNDQGQWHDGAGNQNDPAGSWNDQGGDWDAQQAAGEPANPLLEAIAPIPDSPGWWMAWNPESGGYWFIQADEQPDAGAPGWQPWTDDSSAASEAQSPTPGAETESTEPASQSDLPGEPADAAGAAETLVGGLDLEQVFAGVDLTGYAPEELAQLLSEAMAEVLAGSGAGVGPTHEEVQ